MTEPTSWETSREGWYPRQDSNLHATCFVGRAVIQLRDGGEWCPGSDSNRHLFLRREVCRIQLHHRDRFTFQALFVPGQDPFRLLLVLLKTNHMPHGCLPVRGDS